MEIDISVIIPVYNTSSYLKKCLDSVINQTKKNIEIICIDDGSTDESFKNLKKYSNSDKRIILLKQQNLGGGSARNLGMKKACGKYLYFLDSDDWIELNLLEECYNVAEKTKSEIVIFKADEYNEKTKKYNNLDYAFQKKWFKKNEFNFRDNKNRIFNSFQNWAWNKFFRREFLVKYNICFQEIFRTNDLYFTCVALVSATKIFLLEKKLVHYRRGISINCQSNNDKYPLDWYKACIKLKKYLVYNKIYNDVEQSFLNEFVSGAYYHLITSKTKYEFALIYNFLKNTGFEKINVRDLGENYYYNKEAYALVKDLCCSDSGEFISNMMFLKKENNKVEYDSNKLNKLEKDNKALNNKIDVLKKAIKILSN